MKLKLSNRKLEPEVMMTLKDVYWYDKLTLVYLTALHNGFVETIINQGPVTGRFLEVGTGTGRIAIGVAKHGQGIMVDAIDLSENMLTVAAENAVEEGVAEKIKFSLGDAKQLPFDDNSFDCVFCHNMLHHISDPLDVAKEINRVVKDHGAVLIRDLIRIPDILVPFHVNLFGLTYNKWMKKEYHDSIKAAFSKEEWIDMCNKSGIEETHVTNQFVTHQSIEKPAKDRRTKYIKVPTSIFWRPFKSMYVSKF